MPQPESVSDLVQDRFPLDRVPEHVREHLPFDLPAPEPEPEPEPVIVLDILASRFSGTVELMTEDGAGGLTTSTVTTGFASDVALGDLDGDGDLDVILAGSFSDPSLILTNDGTGTFTAETIATSASVEGVALGDLDGDGDLDGFLATSFGENRVLLNGEDGLQEQTVAGGFRTSIAAALGDLDGDDDLDAVVVNSGAASQVLLNQGPDGQDGIAFAASDLEASQEFANDVALGDLNGDGNLDAFVANWGFNQLYLGDGQGNLTASATPGGDFDTRAVAIADLNGDAYLDVFLANSLAANQILFNDGSGGFVVQEAPGGAQDDSRSAAIGDLDADGDLDIFVGNVGSANQILINDGQGVFSVFDAPTSDGIAVAIGDLVDDPLILV